ncbi:lipoprotein signal peptidase [Buchnera aphidicola (Nipponaphis monzeni)]|uniref:Lipoprotein signal peptidase n=1 Tax=Buchnera aphidicola (Nipponaphis monzeni) TaxID=2495405 RepID=A0A455T9X3_9GAMM|nr:signal peptidase II [Buchnera aphidicola]BBI01132.1 lipoprotein signal peptidase [Buchnera aphidicola (Nipponaphis monzeni)]
MKSVHYIIFFIIILFDYFTKIWVINYIHLYEKKYIFCFLNLYCTNNYGIILGLFNTCNILNCWYLFIINFVSILILIIIQFTTHNIFKKKISTNIAYMFILGGGIGNFIDRMQNGYVIDFIDIHCFNYHFPTFNVADFNIFLGFFLLLK